MPGRLSARTRDALPVRRLVVALVLGSLVLHGLQLAALAAGRELLDRRTRVSDLRLDAALETFRPVTRSGLAQPTDPVTFTADRNPRTEPADCRPLVVLTVAAPLDGRSWTGVNGRPTQPVTLLAVRFDDADAARRELDRKRLALLRCSRAAVTFPPFDAPATVYRVSGRHWFSSAVGDTVRWSLVGDDRRFDFYVRRYGNVLIWTYADDVSTPEVREEVADSLVTRLQELGSS